MTDIPPLPTPFRRADVKVEAALELARQGQITVARQLLAIPEATVRDTELLDAVHAFADGLRLFKEDRHSDAVPYLVSAAAVLGKSDDAEIRLVVELIKALADGVSRLSYGDVHGAMGLLDFSAEQTRRLAFFYPELENVAVKAKALSYIAIARAYLNVGDLTQARQWFTKADQEHTRFLEILQRDEDADPLHFAAVYVTRLELVILMARVEFEALDVEGAGRFLRTADDDLAKLEKHLAKAPDTLSSRVMRAIAALIRAMKKLQPVAEHVLRDRISLSQEHVATLREADELLFQARELALEGGQVGATYLYSISQLQRLRLNLLKVGAVSRADFGRLAGPVTAGTLIALMTTIHLTFSPTGVAALGFFFAAVTVSLITGFGYGALRFKPLLNSIKEELERTGSGSS